MKNAVQRRGARSRLGRPVANTLRGYRSDWVEFTGCARHDAAALPAVPSAVSGYLTYLAGHGVKVGTVSRRLSTIASPHELRNLPDRGDTPASSPSGKGSDASTAPRPTKLPR